MDWLTIIPLVMKYGPDVVSLITQAVSNEDLETKLRNLSAPVASLIENIGSTLFPQASSTLHIVAGAIAAFNPDLVKWIQSGLSAVMTPSPNLVVDGIYGPKTKAAIQAFQKQQGLVIDGIAGALTQAAIDGLLASQPRLPKP